MRKVYESHMSQKKASPSNTKVTVNKRVSVHKTAHLAYSDWKSKDTWWCPKPIFPI